MRYWKNKRTGVKYHEGSRSNLYKRHYFRNKTTGETYSTGARTNISYEKTGLFRKKRFVKIGTLHKGDRFHARVWNHYKEKNFKVN